METDGKTANSKQAKLSKVRYFFVKDRIHQKEIKWAYFPSYHMWSDILTKPLQGSKLKTMKAQYMSCPF